MTEPNSPPRDMTDQTAADKATPDREAIIRDLSEALEPFAREARRIMPYLESASDKMALGPLAMDNLNIGHFRRAAAALAMATDRNSPPIDAEDLASIRAGAAEGIDYGPGYILQLVDEIERLRAVLTEIRARCQAELGGHGKGYLPGDLYELTSYALGIWRKGAAPAADEAATETPAKSPDKGRRGGPKPL